MEEVKRPTNELIEGLYEVSSATASAILAHMGIRDCFLQGPVCRTPGMKVAGPAVTLQFMPKREDLLSEQEQENIEKKTALWQVLEHISPGDVLVMDARGDMRTGCLGEMLLTYFKTKGGAGVIVDGCIRDYPKVRNFDVPLWTRGVTPNYASQTTLFPWDFNVPVACGGVLVIPGDIIIADDDGAVVVPINLSEKVMTQALGKEEKEKFSRMKLEQGGQLTKYYPLNDEAKKEYEIWKKQNS